MTRPAASSSGPPELPGLIAASVWSTLSMAKPFGALMRRWTAEMTPVVSVRSRPKGLPIAIVGSPTWAALLSPSCSGCRSSPEVSTRRTARSVDRSCPTIRAVAVFLSANWTVTLARALDDVLVREDRALAGR